MTPHAPTSAQDNRRVTIVTGADENYLAHVEVVAVSMVAAATTDRPIDFHVLYQSAESAASERLGQFARGPVRIIMHYVNNPLNKLGGLRHLTTATFLRFVIPDHLSTESRAVYIDSDIIILDDIAKLHDTELDGKPLGAVHDMGMWMFRDAGDRPKAEGFEGTWEEYMARFLSPEYFDGYINAGILVMDLEQWRAHNYGALGREVVTKWNKRLLFRDQDTTNMIFHDKVKHIDPRWNALALVLQTPLRKFRPGMRRELARQQRQNTALVHFAALSKPWLRSAYIPHADYWWIMAEHSSGYAGLREGHRALMRKRRTIPLSLPTPLTYWRTREVREKLSDLGLPPRRK